MAQHARRQFEEGRETLSEVKRFLKRFAEHTLVGQVNDALVNGQIGSVEGRFSGQWEWCVTLRRGDSQPTVFLQFGPTAVVENARAPEPLVDPDYSKVFVTRKAIDQDGTDQLVQTQVGLGEVLAGLSGDDSRLRDAVLAVINA